MTRADPNKRVCALLIDSFIIGLLNIFFDQVLHINTSNSFLYLLTFLLYVFRDSYRGQSPGKMLVGLKATDLNDSPVSYGASFKRNIILFWPNFIYVFIPAPKSEMYAGDQWSTSMTAHAGLGVVGLMILFIEYIAATRSKDGRRIGDMMAGTKVVDLKPETPGWIFGVVSVALIAVQIFMGMLLAPKP